VPISVFDSEYGFFQGWNQFDAAPGEYDIKWEDLVEKSEVPSLPSNLPLNMTFNTRHPLLPPFSPHRFPLSLSLAPLSLKIQMNACACICYMR